MYLLFEVDGVLLIDDKKKTELLNSDFAFVLTVKEEHVRLKWVEQTLVTWELKLKMREEFVREHMQAVSKFKSLDLIIIF